PVRFSPDNAVRHRLRSSAWRQALLLAVRDRCRHPKLPGRSRPLRPAPANRSSHAASPATSHPRTACAVRSTGQSGPPLRSPPPDPDIACMRPRKLTLHYPQRLSAQPVRASDIDHESTFPEKAKPLIHGGSAGNRASCAASRGRELPCRSLKSPSNPPPWESSCSSPSWPASSMPSPVAVGCSPCRRCSPPDCRHIWYWEPTSCAPPSVRQRLATPSIVDGCSSRSCGVAR